jgi:hypothetical protein
LARQAADLFHHQFWFFGRDIHHPAGNLLIRRGFKRFGVPEGESGGNAYRFRFDERREIVLWGFGLFFGDKTRGGIFLRRYEFPPKFLNAARLRLPIWKPEQIPAPRLPRDEFEAQTVWRLTLDALVWITDYETWVEEICGANWREQCLREWKNARLGQRLIRRRRENLIKHLEQL